MRRFIDIGARGSTWVIVAPSGVFWVGMAHSEEDAWDRAATQYGYAVLRDHEIQQRKDNGWYVTQCNVTWQEPRKLPTPQARTFQEWKDLGFHVMRGERHTGRREDGICTFEPNQVAPIHGYTGNGRKYRGSYDGGYEDGEFDRDIGAYELCVGEHGD